MSLTPSFKTAKSDLRMIGISLTCDMGELRVNFADGKEVTAYYTNDLHDAYQTGIRMARVRMTHHSNRV